jgi:diadenosine tetraphosphate (Ap4A) HIT family hydrolase
MTNRKSIDVEGYIHKTKHGPCFICEIVKGNRDFYHYIVYEDNENIVFLNKYQTYKGYLLAAPKKHLIEVTSDYSIEGYLSFQRLIYRTSEALRKVVETERIYILSLGSHQGNSHVHWHIMPLPPNVVYEKQQCEALRLENGFLELSDKELTCLAKRIRDKM